MRLESETGATLVLGIDGYQFPDAASDERVDPHGWDANWLVVSGTLTLPDGRSHVFSDPCLTTWEAARLHEWLSELSRGRAPEEADGPTLVFTEPCLAFAASRLDAERVEIRVYLSLEAAPPFVVAGSAGMVENYVPLRVDRGTLGVAAAAWAEDLRPFPVPPDRDGPA